MDYLQICFFHLGVEGVTGGSGKVLRRGKEDGGIRRTVRPTSEPAAPVRLETAPAVAYIVREVLVEYVPSMREPMLFSSKTYGADEATSGGGETIELCGREGGGCSECNG